VCHRTGDVDRGGNALRGQRDDQYPQHEGVHEGPHADQSSIGEVPQSHDTAPQHPGCGAGPCVERRGIFAVRRPLPAPRRG
jgi:hypothetical protein